MDYEMKLGSLINKVNNFINEIIIFDSKYAENERKEPIRILNFDYKLYGDIKVSDFTITTNNKNNDVILKIFINKRI